MAGRPERETKESERLCQARLFSTPNRRNHLSICKDYAQHLLVSRCHSWIPTENRTCLFLSRYGPTSLLPIYVKEETSGKASISTLAFLYHWTRGGPAFHSSFS